MTTPRYDAARALPSVCPPGSTPAVLSRSTNLSHPLVARFGTPSASLQRTTATKSRSIALSARVSPGVAKSRRQRWQQLWCSFFSHGGLLRRRAIAMVVVAEGRCMASVAHPLTPPRRAGRCGRPGSEAGTRLEMPCGRGVSLGDGRAVQSERLFHRGSKLLFPPPDEAGGGWRYAYCTGWS